MDEAERENDEAVPAAKQALNDALVRAVKADDLAAVVKALEEGGRW